MSEIRHCIQSRALDKAVPPSLDEGAEVGEEKPPTSILLAVFVSGERRKKMLKTEIEDRTFRGATMAVALSLIRQ